MKTLQIFDLCKPVITYTTPLHIHPPDGIDSYAQHRSHTRTHRHAQVISIIDTDQYADWYARDGRLAGLSNGWNGTLISQMVFAVGPRVNSDDRDRHNSGYELNWNRSET